MTNTQRSNSTSASAPRISAGFTLLEVLVTLVVVSIGILGILGMQTAALINTRVSASHSNAVVLADNFAARMHANPNPNDNADNDYDNIESHTDPSSIDPPDCTDGCTPGEIVDRAVYEWSRQLRRLLPRGRGYVDCVNDTPCQAYRITIAWTEHDPTDKHLTNNNAANNQQNTSDRCKNDPPGQDLPDGYRCFVTTVRL